MLDYNQLIQILNDSDIDTTEYRIENLKNIYGSNIPDNAFLGLIEEMVLATIDFDTPLYDALAYINDFESKQNIDEFCSCIFDVFEIILFNLKICKQNAERLLDLTEDVDILEVYNLLMFDFKEFLTKEQIEKLDKKAKNAFDQNIITW